VREGDQALLKRVGIAVARVGVGDRVPDGCLPVGAGELVDGGAGVTVAAGVGAQQCRVGARAAAVSGAGAGGAEQVGGHIQAELQPGLGRQPAVGAPSGAQHRDAVAQVTLLAAGGRAGQHLDRGGFGPVQAAGGGDQGAHRVVVVVDLQRVPGRHEGG
jgi:hypothetical protein